MSSVAKKAQAALLANRKAAYDLSTKKGGDATRSLLDDAARELKQRLMQVETTGAGEGSFTAVQMRSTLAQIEATLATLTGGLTDLLLTEGKRSASKSVRNQLNYLKEADKAFRGVGVQPLALPETSMMDRAVKNTESSLLRRLVSTPEDTPEKMGILNRYGVETVGVFEQRLQQGLLQKKSWVDMRNDLIAESPFLQAEPVYWAERIVRTELMGAYNRAGYEAGKVVQEELGDMLKILAATFDDRTAADSYAVHGQIRKPSEAFSDWFHNYLNPPNRPNDRETIVWHRMRWELPSYLEPRSDAEVAARWRKEGRKGSPPARPLMETVDRSLIGKRS